MRLRAILSGFILLSFVADATAQNRSRWRPGSILGGLRFRVQEARQDRNEQMPTLAPVEGASDGFVAADHRQDSPHPVQNYPTAPQLAPPPRPAQPNGQFQEQTSRAVTIDDVIELVHRGLGESTIVRYIGDNGVRQRLEVTDLIRLHEEGVSEPIINAMQTAKVFAAVPRQTSNLPFTDGHAVDQASRFPEPPRRSTNVDGFGQSILQPPARPVPRTPSRDGLSAD